MRISTNTFEVKTITISSNSFSNVSLTTSSNVFTKRSLKKSVNRFTGDNLSGSVFGSGTFGVREFGGIEHFKNKIQSTPSH